MRVVGFKIFGTKKLEKKLKVDRIALERVNGKFIPVNTEVAPEDDCPF